MITNHDMSSTGFSCELTVFYDGDIGRMDFTDNFHVHEHDGYRTTAVYEYTGCERDHLERVLDLFEFSDTITQKQYRKALLQWYLGRETEWWKPTVRSFFDEYGYGKDIDWKETVMDAIRDDDDMTIYQWAKEEQFDLLDHLDGEWSCKFRVKSSTGYSQGDYALVLIPIEYDGEDGQHKESIDKTIDHYLWDQPVYARLTVTDQETGEEDEIHLEEFLDDIYEWDKDKVIEGLKKLGHETEDSPCTRNEPLPPSVIEWAEEHIPNEPSYT